MVGRFGPGRRARRQAWVGAAVSAAALLALSGSAAAEWLPPHDLSPLGNTYSPRTVVGADGVVHAFWDRDGAGGIETAGHVPGASWSEPLRLSAAGAETGVVRPAANAAGDLVVIWYDVNGGQKRIQTASRPQGGEWSAPDALPSVRDVSSPALALAPDGTATAMWMELDAATSMTTIRSSVRPRGGSWSAPVTVSNPAEHSFSPNVVVDRQGTATVLWYQATAGGINRTYASSRPAGGAWSTPELLSHHDWAATSNVAVADDGTVFATWKAREPSLRYAIEVAVRRPDGSWSVRYDVDGGTALGNNADTPDVAVDTGEATVVWTRKVGSWNLIQTITRAAGSDTWSEPATLSADGRNAFGQTVRYDPDGNAIVAWYRRNDVNYVVQVSERTADGTWSEPVNLSTPAATSLELADLSLAFDGDGDTIATWYRADGVAGRRVQTTTDDTSGPRLADVVVPETATEATGSRSRSPSPSTPGRRSPGRRRGASATARPRPAPPPSTPSPPPAPTR